MKKGSKVLALDPGGRTRQNSDRDQIARELTVPITRYSNFTSKHLLFNLVRKAIKHCSYSPVDIAQPWVL